MEENVEALLRGGWFMRLIEQQAADIRRKYDLKKVDIEVLYYLSLNPTDNAARDIQKYLKINKGYLSQVLDGLCKKGYLTASPDPVDRRYVHYLLSDRTRSITEEICAERNEVNRRIFEGITEEEREIFRKTAEKIEQNIMDMLHH